MTEASSCLATLASRLTSVSSVLAIVDTVAICLLLAWVGWVEVRMRR